MTKPKRAESLNAVPCWKVRLVMRGGALLHVLSATEPVVAERAGKVIRCDLEHIDHTEHGDSVGFIDWAEVAAITWRFAPATGAPVQERKKDASDY